MEVRGRDIVAGLPKTMTISSEEIRDALTEPVSNIVEAVRTTLGNCEPELAVDLGFADEIMTRPADAGAENHVTGPMLFSRAAVTNHLMDKLAAKCRIEKKPTQPERSVDDLMERLNLMKH